MSRNHAGNFVALMLFIGARQSQNIIVIARLTWVYEIWFPVCQYVSFRKENTNSILKNDTFSKIKI